jgi:hypothetical protein
VSKVEHPKIPESPTSAGGQTNSALSKLGAASLFMLSQFSLSSCNDHTHESAPTPGGGDTLWRIAARIEPDPNQIEAAIHSIRTINELRSTVIREGLVLLLPSPERLPDTNEVSPEAPTNSIKSSKTAKLSLAEIQTFVRSLLDTDFGSMCRNFKSGDTISARSNCSVDSGGTTHGCYQLSASTIPDFIAYLKHYSRDESLTAEQRKVAKKACDSLRGHAPESRTCKKEWSHVSLTDPHDFRFLQHRYSPETHLFPVLALANRLNFPINAQMAEVYMSLGAQHSPEGNRKILEDVCASLNPSTSPSGEVVAEIYRARRDYVEGLRDRALEKVDRSNKLTDEQKAMQKARIEKMWNSIIDYRYAEECRFALRLVQGLSP